MKKKLTLLFTLLALCCSAWATTPKILALPQPGKIYYMAGYYDNSGSPLKVYLYADGSSLKANVSYAENGDFAYLWLCEKSEDGYTFRNLKSGTYLKGPGTSSNPSLNATATVFNIVDDAVQNADCISLRTGTDNNSRWSAVNFTDGSPNRMTSSLTYYEAGSKYWTTDFLLIEYAAKTLSHNQYYYIYCDNDDSENVGTDRRQYIYNGTGATLPVQIDESKVSLTNYAWRAIRYFDSSNPTNDYFYFKNGTKYIGWHSLSDETYKWYTNKNTSVIGAGRVMLWGSHKGGRYMAFNYNDTESSSSAGFSDKDTGLPKSKAWSQDFMFCIAPQTVVHRVAIKVEAPFYANPVFTYDGFDYSGDCSIYIDGNNMPETKAISVKSSDVSFLGFYLEDGTSLGTTLNVSDLTADKGVIAKFYPFKISTDFATATWYHMNVGGKWAYYDGKNFPAVEDLDDAIATADASCWAFVQTAGGLNVINYSAGNAKYVSSGATPLVMIDSSTGFAVWTYTGKGDGINFTLDNDGYYMQSGNWATVGMGLGYETSGASSASAVIYLSPVDWKDIYTAKLNLFATERLVGECFGVQEGAIAEQQDMIDNDGISATASNYSVWVDYLYSTVALNFVKPGTGFYRLKNKSNSCYMGISGNKFVGNIDPSAINTNLSTIIYVERNGTNGIRLSTQGKYGQEAYGGVDVSVGDNAPGSYFTLEAPKPGYGAIKTSSDASSYYTIYKGNISGWNTDGDDACWTFEDVTEFEISLNAAEDNTGAAHTYATLCVPFSITGLTGVDNKEVKAYAPTKSGDFIVPGDGATTINAGTPVLLIGEEGATSVTATIGSSYVTAPTTTNALTGVFSGQTIDTRAETGVNYVLGKDATNSNRIGFYHVNNENFALNANRAYLKLDGSGDPAHVKGYVISFDFDDDDATGVTSPLEETGEGASIYNLSGQRMNKMQKGINIVNGKKILK